ncbi:MAG: TadE/TadG family type IV pilus assembly protein, partial [Actinomycetota bacterium]
MRTERTDRATTEPTVDPPPRGERTDERGIAMVQTALLIVPLIVLAAFATDIGSWYVEGQKVQRAVDAAALAGVAFLPDADEAEAAARETAARNGFVDATPGDNSDFDTGPLPQVRVTVYGTERLEVEIKTEATAYLGQIVVDSIDIHRRGLAEFIQDVHLGNPTSGLGTGDIAEAALGLPSDRVWLSVNA